MGKILRPNYHPPRLTQLYIRLIKVNVLLRRHPVPYICIPIIPIIMSKAPGTPPRSTSPRAGKLRLSVILMIATITGLAVFQGYWIKKLYAEEWADLKRE